MKPNHSFQGQHNIDYVRSFWIKVDKKSDDECWEWKASFFRGNGYGLFWYNGKKISAHRFSYFIHNGEIPNGLYVCHHCDNHKCVNPKHLFLGTALDNERDKMSKSRQASGKKNGQAGTKAWSNKLSEKDIIDIRNIYASKQMSQKDLSIKYGVANGTISRIVNKVRWAWLV